MSSMLSAPAAIPATSEESFNPAWAPLSVGTWTCSSASSRRPACSARAISGTRPATDTRLGSSNVAETTGRVLYLRDALLELTRPTLDKSYPPSSEGHSHAPTSQPSTTPIGGSRFSHACVVSSDVRFIGNVPPAEFESEYHRRVDSRRQPLPRELRPPAEPRPVSQGGPQGEAPPRPKGSGPFPGVRL